MNNFLILSKALLKNTSFSLGTKKKASTILLLLLLSFSFIPVLYSLYEVFSMGLELCLPFRQTATITTLVLQLCSILIFMFGIFIIPSFYYFGEDIEVLLRLPLKPHEIIASKFVQCYVSEFIFVLFVMIPFGFAYFHLFDFSLITFLLMILITLILPIYPLIICSIIVMVLMRFTPFFANRDRFQLIAGFLGVVFALGLSWGINQLFEQTSQSEIVYLFISGDNKLATLFTYLFPALSLGAHTIVDMDWFSLLGFIGFHIITFGCFLVIAKFLYFKGVIGISQTSSKQAKNKQHKLKHKVQSPYFSYLKKEIIMLLKTPTYALNCVGMVLIFPISILIGFISGSGDLDFSIFANLDYQGYEGLMFIIGLCGGLLFASFNLTSSTALSREGKNYTFMKYIPVSYKIQMLAKISSGIIFSLLMMIFTFGFAIYLFPYLPLHYYIIMIISSIVALVFFNFIALILDFIHPKLIWDNEAEAVKQNFFSMFSMLIAIAICALLILALVFISVDYWFIIGLSCMLIMLILTIVLYMNLDKIGTYFMRKL